MTTPEQKTPPPPASEFQLAVLQMVIKFASAAEGDEARLAAMSRAQAVCARVCRKVITRSQILNKRWSDWTQAELLEFVCDAEQEDQAGA